MNRFNILLLIQKSNIEIQIIFLCSSSYFAFNLPGVDAIFGSTMLCLAILS